MQKFEMPKMNVEEFEIVDAIMTGSFVECEEDLNCENQTAVDW